MYSPCTPQINQHMPWPLHIEGSLNRILPFLKGVTSFVITPQTWIWRATFFLNVYIYFFKQFNIIHVYAGEACCLGVLAPGHSGYEVRSTDLNLDLRWRALKKVMSLMTNATPGQSYNMQKSCIILGHREKERTGNWIKLKSNLRMLSFLYNYVHVYFLIRTILSSSLDTFRNKCFFLVCF